MMAGAKRKAANRERMWNITQAHEEITAHELSAASGFSVDTAAKALRDWVRSGHVTEAGKRGARKCFKLTGKAGKPPVMGEDGNPVILNATAEERMWFAMRKSGGVFSANDVSMWANSESLPVSVSDAGKYCRSLLDAGYLRCEVKADGKGRPALYRMIRDTGPRAPIERRMRGLLDPNTNQYRLLGGRVS